MYIVLIYYLYQFEGLTKTWPYQRKRHFSWPEDWRTCASSSCGRAAWQHTSRAVSSSPRLAIFSCGSFRPCLTAISFFLNFDWSVLQKSSRLLYFISVWEWYCYLSDAKGMSLSRLIRHPRDDKWILMVVVRNHAPIKTIHIFSKCH